MIIVIVLVQISLIAATFDGFTNISWKLTLIPLLPIALLSMSALLFLVLYITILKCYYPYDFHSKKYTLLYLQSNILGINCIIAVILADAYLAISPAITASISLVFTSLIAIVLFIYNEELAVCFCRHK